MFRRQFTNILVGLFWLSVNSTWQKAYAQVNDYQAIRLRQYNVSQGLPSDACTKLYKDSYGFLWVSTYYGVSIFNGNRFTNLPVYSTQKGYYLGDCPYTFLQVNKDSMLISCSDGLYIFAYASNHITKVAQQPVVPSRARISILGFNMFHSRILVKIGGVIYSFDRGLQMTGSMQCVNEDVEMSTGNGFYAPYYFYYSKSGYLISLDTESGKADTLLYRPGERGGMIVNAESSAGYLVATSTAVLILDARSGRVKQTIPLPPIPRGLFFIPFCVKKDPNGNFWIGGRANLFIYFPATQTVAEAGTSFTDSIANKAIIVNDIVQDTDGIFLATISNGVLKYDNRYTLFEDFHLPAATNNSVYPGIVAGSRLLCAPNTGGILGFDLGDTPDIYRLYPVSRKYGDITAMEPLDDHYVWLIFRDKFKLAVASLSDFRLKDSVFPVDQIGEAYFNKINNEFPRIDLQPVIKKVAANSFYYSIRNYLYLIRGDPGKGFDFTLVDSVPPTAYISAIGLSSGGGVTIVTGDFELFELRAARLFKRFSPIQPMSLPAKSICTDDAGNIYLITINGLYILDKEYRLRRHLTESSSRMLSNVLYAGSIDNNGLLWMAANGGLIGYDTKTGRIFNFSSDRLLHGREFNSRSVFSDSAGNIYFGGTNGVTEVHTRLIASQSAGNKLYFEKIKDLDSVLHFGIMPGSFGAQTAFPYNNNTFSFSIGSLSYQQLEDVDYRYRLDGFDTSWSAPTNNYTVSYINLPPGTYRFRVSQPYADATPAQEISYSFRIDKPYWQKFWFLAVVVLSVACLLFFIIRYVMDKRLEQQRIEVSKEMAVKTERERISQELHDDLGSGLTSIRLLAKSVIAKQQTDGKTLAMLQNIARISSELIDQMSEIVWLMNHMHDTMNGLLAHLRAYMAEYLQRTGIALQLNFNNELQADNFITGQQRRSILLVVKEAFHNVVKHSQANHFNITCSADENVVTFLIWDDGIGLPESSSPTGNGLNNIRKNIAAISGMVLFESRAGTCITITIPIDKKRR